MTQPQRHVLFAGGRSGGHVFPAVAVAEELLGRGWRVGFVGTEDGLEARVTQQRGLPFFPLAAAPLVGRDPLARLRALALLGASSLRAWRLVRRLQPGVVFGTGGFVSAPGVIGGWLARCRIFLFEPNAQAGFANRWLSRLARGAAIAFEATARQLRCPTVVTGVPVRAEFFADGALPSPTPRRLLVLGGSQGARQLNQLLPRAVARLADEQSLADGSLEVLHQAGFAHRQETEEGYRQALADTGVRFEVVDFLDDVAGAMRRSHLVISRAGAITLAEICAAGRPSLLVPLHLAGAHQIDNAVALERQGAAVVLGPEGVDQASLAGKLGPLLSNLELLESMSSAARAVSRPRAGAAIAELLERLIADGPEAVREAEG